LNSEISLLAAHAENGKQKVSPLLYDVLQRSMSASKKSGDTFSVYAGALTLLWRQARKQQKFPSKKQVSKARRLSLAKHFDFNIQDSSLNIKVHGASLDFGGIVKGYTAQKVIDHLLTKNIRQAMADAGGDLVMSDTPPGKKGWSVAVSLPDDEDTAFIEKRIWLNNKAVATSGNMYQYLERNGKKYSHILNPKTGYGIISQRQVTVIANDGATADWLATACSVLPLSKALKLAESEAASILILEIINGNISVHKSATFNGYFY